MFRRPLPLVGLVCIMWCVLLAPASTAWGAIRLQSPPAGWSGSGQDAAAQAAVWAEAVGGRVTAALSSRGRDDFTEILAVLRIDRPIPEDVAERPDEVVDAFLGQLVGEAEFEITDVTLVPPADEYAADAPAVIIEGQYETGGVVVFFALASGGSTSGLLLLTARSIEAPLYASTFADAIDDLDGLAAPVTAFNIGRLRVLSIVAWMLTLVATWIFASRRVGPNAHPAEHGRVAINVLVVLIPLVGIVAYFALGGAAARLAAVGLSRAWAAAEIALWGLAALAIVGVVTAVRGAQVKPVQSAPTGGIFAERTRAPAMPSVPNAHRETVISGVADGPSTLEAATPPPVETPRPPEVPLPSVAPIDLPADPSNEPTES